MQISLPTMSRAVAPTAIASRFADLIDDANRHIGYGVMGYRDPELWPGDFPRLTNSALESQAALTEAINIGGPSSSVAFAKQGLELIEQGLDIGQHNEPAAVALFEEASQVVWQAWRDAGS